MKAPAFIRLAIRNIVVNTDPGTIFFMLGLPAFYFLVLGTMFQSIVPGVQVNGSLVSYTKFLAPGIVGMQALTAGNIGGSMLWSDRRWHMFEQLMVGPFRRLDYLLGILVISTVFTFGGSAIMLILAHFVSGSFILTVPSLAFTFLALILGSFLFTSLFLIIAILVRTLQTYNVLTILIYFFLDFASTAFYPITNSTPVVLRYISMVNPLSYITNIIRSSIDYGYVNSILTESLILFAITLVIMIISLRMYSRLKTVA
ncbi:ABC transporter permease [Oxyplasma meridianum]|uniref:ABC transporter permease n=1 Tax=Oxyplasma meridianum TaxID=3073602 RepID=A0AAX4NGZ7_9ARCH